MLVYVGSIISVNDILLFVFRKAQNYVDYN